MYSSGNTNTHTRSTKCQYSPAISTSSAVHLPPRKPIPKGAYGTSFWVMVLLDKYLFQRPTHRMLSMLRMTLDLDMGSFTQHTVEAMHLMPSGNTPIVRAAPGPPEPKPVSPARPRPGLREPVPG